MNSEELKRLSKPETVKPTNKVKSKNKLAYKTKRGIKVP